MATYLCKTQPCTSTDLTERVLQYAQKKQITSLESATNVPRPPPPPPVSGEVVVQCTGCNKWKHFHLEAGDVEITGQTLTDDEEKAFKKLREAVSYEKSTEHINTYAKWLLSGTGISALATVFSSKLLEGMKNGNETLQVIAACLLGLGIALAAWVMKPSAPRRVELNDPGKLQKKLESRLERRGWTLLVAAVLSSTALVLLALAPLDALKSTPTVRQVSLTYTFNPKTGLTASLKGEGLESNEGLELEVRQAEEPKRLISSVRAAAKQDGTGSADLRLEALEQSYGPLVLSAFTQKKEERKLEQAITFKDALPTTAPAVAARKPLVAAMYSFTPTGKLEFEFQATGLTPYAPVEFRLEQKDKPLGWVRRAATVAGELAAFKFELAQIDLGNGPLHFILVGEEEGATKTYFEQTIPAQSPTEVTQKGGP